jgi:hypothetical protein
MNIATFKYKCRRCGEVYNDASIGETFAFGKLLLAVAGNPDGIHLLSIHPCKDEGHGISDLQGYDIEKENESSN